MAEPTLDELRAGFRGHGVEPPPEYVWVIEHRMLGFDAFTQFEPWHLCGVAEILPLSKRWPSAGITRDLIPFARMQGSDDLACFEFAGGKAIRVCTVHYNIGRPVYVEISKEYATLWDWLQAAVCDAKVWFEIAQGARQDVGETSIEIPKVDSLAQIDAPLEQVPKVCHFLLTALLRCEDALLYTEYYRPEPDVTWYVRRRSEEREGDDEVVAVLPSAILQSFAARLAVLLKIHHTEGGYARAVLSQDGRRYDCRVFLSNCRASGYWLRVYARAM